MWPRADGVPETGESEIYCHQELLDYDILSEDVDFDSPEQIQCFVNQWTGRYAATDDMHDPERFKAEVPENKRVSARGIEVGHIFFFGDIFKTIRFLKNQEVPRSPKYIRR